MAYFDVQFTTFLAELAENNNKEWFQENKTRYQTHVEKPFKKFVADFIKVMSPIMPDLNVTEKECIFRIYRDVRFSLDKTPYKTQVSAIIGKDGRKGLTSPGIYVELSGKECRLYSGLYELSIPQIEKVRKHIYYNQSLFEQLVNDADFVKNFGEIRGEKYKRVPPQYADVAAKQPLILNKSFYFFKTYPKEVMFDSNILDHFVNDYMSAIKINDFLKEALLED